MSGKDPSTQNEADRSDWFLESYVLDFWGRLCLGGPRQDQIPIEDETVRKHLAGNFYAVPFNRIPKTWSATFGRGAQWNTQVRYFEHKLVKFMVPLVAAVLCTLFVAIGTFVASSTKGIEDWNDNRKAANAAEEAREYAAKRDAIMKSLAVEIAGYDAKKCLDEAAKLRVRETPEERDRYAAIEQGCSDKRQELVTMGRNWSVQQCAEFAIAMNNDKKSNGQFTWADNQVFHAGCSGGHDLNELNNLINRGG